MSPMPDRQPMSTAPRDGRTVIVGDDDVGEFLMRWNVDARNDLFAPGVSGMWEAPDKSMTWTEHEGAGPTYWRNLNS